MRLLYTKFYTIAQVVYLLEFIHNLNNQRSLLSLGMSSHKLEYIDAEYYFESTLAILLLLCAFLPNKLSNHQINDSSNLL